MPAFRRVTLALAAALSACGGGDPQLAGARLLCTGCTTETPSAPAPSAPAPSQTLRATAEGYWEGSGGPYNFATLILEDGTTYVAYARGGAIEGLMYGMISSSGSALTGSLTDFNARLSTVTAGSVSGSFTAAGRLVGTANFGSRSYALNAAYNPVYDSTADLSEFAGTWSGSAGSKDGIGQATFQVAADGRFSAATGTCTATGTAAPLKAGKHPLRIDASFTGATCPLAGRSVSGVAIVSRSGSRQQLQAAGLLPDHSDGFFGIATR